MLINGIPLNRRKPPFETQDSEVIDINDNANECNNFNKYPLVLSESTGVRIKEKVIICGGYNQDDRFFWQDNYQQQTNKCYIGDQNGFKFLTKLPERLSSAASLVYNDTMWVTGGSNFERQLRSRSSR